MTSVYNLLREACGISQTEAAERVHDTRLDTVKSWCSGRRQAPEWAINQLQKLLREIRAAGEAHAELMRRNTIGNVVILGHAHDDADARSLGFPSMAAERQALAIAISLLPDDWQVQVIPRIRGSHPAPILEPERPTPTTTDRQVLKEMIFVDGKCLTEGKMNRRKFERLEDIGWIKGIERNGGNDVVYHLTQEGLEARLEGR